MMANMSTDRSESKRRFNEHFNHLLAVLSIESRTTSKMISDAVVRSKLATFYCWLRLAVRMKNILGGPDLLRAQLDELANFLQTEFGETVNYMYRTQEGVYNVDSVEPDGDDHPLRPLTRSERQQKQSTLIDTDYCENRELVDSLVFNPSELCRRVKDQYKHLQFARSQWTVVDHTFETQLDGLMARFEETRFWSDNRSDSDSEGNERGSDPKMGGDDSEQLPGISSTNP